MRTNVTAVPAPIDDTRPAAGAPRGERIPRFNRTERGVHWVQATSFLVLLVSGFALALPQLESLIGHRALLREIHLSSAFFLFFGPAIVALAGDRRVLARDVAEVDRWDRDDLRWLIPSPILRLWGVRTPPQGRFNAGQKLNALFVAWSTVTFSVTGLLTDLNDRRHQRGLPILEIDDDLMDVAERKAVHQLLTGCSDQGWDYPECFSDMFGRSLLLELVLTGSAATMGDRLARQREVFDGEWICCGIGVAGSQSGQVVLAMVLCREAWEPVVDAAQHHSRPDGYELRA